MKRWMMIMGVILLFAMGGAATLAGPQDFVLYNQTGVDIYEVYVSPSNSNYWGSDVLGGDILYNGYNTRITFNNYSQAYWDLKVKDRNGNSLYWRNINLLRYSRIYLRYDGYRAWAIYE